MKSSSPTEIKLHPALPRVLLHKSFGAAESVMIHAGTGTVLYFK